MRAHSAWSFAVAVGRAAIRHRANGHAAETAFFGLLSLIPATITMGGVLHLLSRIGGPALAQRGVEGATEAIRFLIGPTLADSVINPFVRTQLTQSRELAITGLFLTAWLTSRAFHALGHALDEAFEARDRRTSRIQRLIALGWAVCLVAVIAVTLALMVLGWHNSKAGLDRFMGQTPVISQLWMGIRWPLLVGILFGVVMGIYRFGPSVVLRWRQCLPGAVVSVLLWLIASVAFRAYLVLGAAAPTGIATHDKEVILIGRAVGASIATGFFMYVTALAILVGAEINGVLWRRARDQQMTRMSPPAVDRSNGRPRAVTTRPDGAPTPRELGTAPQRQSAN
ncbi:MAG TPA: YihY/virulence factor BrkB family protein [Jatrophihabitans sp.]|nr:YihY/virulence factor BrkB family protein [Jatrophihabitans sp.]